jgi:ribose transport system ATP-binding protein
VKMMVGREMEAEYPFQINVQPDREILRVENLKYKGNANGVSFVARRGELLGIAGLVGSGRTETMRAIFGADRREAGTISVDGVEVNIKNPKDAVKAGICLLTEDRKRQGLILDMSVYANITLTDFAQVSRAGLLNREAEHRGAKGLVADLSIKTPSVNQLVRNLSGGNQQKVVLAKWLFRHTNVMIFDEPTRGIDVGAKYEIYLLLWKLAAEGKGIIIVSSDLPELLGICHRIVVFSNGKIAGEVERAAFDQEAILSLAYQEYIKGKEQ